MTIEYGHVTAVEVTTRESAMARNMLIGGLVGLAIKDSFSGALGGATAGFVVTSIMENDKRVFAYTVQLDDNRYETVALTRPDVAIGHCAALERDAKHVNLRPVSAVHCDSLEGDEESPGDEHRETAAEKCSAARTALARRRAALLHGSVRTLLYLGRHRAYPAGYGRRGRETMRRSVSTAPRAVGSDVAPDVAARFFFATCRAPLSFVPTDFLALRSTPFAST